MKIEDRLIASQAKDIFEKDARIVELEGALRDIELFLICIGGPLNDNVMQYSADQLKIFFRIINTIKDVI